MSRSSNMRVIAAVLAGGTGERLGGERPKQFLELGGIPLLAHSLLAFERSPDVTEIILVSHPDHADASAAVAAEAGISKLAAVVAGGQTRSDSSRAAIDAVPDAASLILIHDAARPLVTAATIGSVVEALQSHRAAAPAIPASDTIVEAHEQEVSAALNRAALRHLQTPQGFEISTIREAYRLAGEDQGFEASDDCGVVHRYLPDVAIKLVPGSARNVKITQAQDLVVAEALLGGP